MKQHYQPRRKLVIAFHGGDLILLWEESNLKGQQKIYFDFGLVKVEKVSGQGIETFFSGQAARKGFKKYILVLSGSKRKKISGL